MSKQMQSKVQPIMFDAAKGKVAIAAVGLSCFLVGETADNSSRSPRLR
jgi:hypothetical protein